MGYYNVMNEKTDILGSIADAVKSILQYVGVAALLTCFFALLFAPAFSGVIEKSMLDKSGVLTDFPEIEPKMKYVRAMLWILAIAAWSLLFGLNLKF